MKWQPIETAPRQVGAVFLAWNKTHGVQTVQRGFWPSYPIQRLGRRGYWVTMRPTYWMPMPDPPGDA
jgi:hypothetical protein